MLQGRQFEQLALFPEPGHVAGMSPAQARNLNVPVGGQYEIPFPKDFGAGKPRPELKAPEATPQQRLMRGEHPVNVYHGGTYPMLMRAHEIRDQFQALDGDREDGYHEDLTGTGDAMTVAGSRVASRHQQARHNDPTPDNPYATWNGSFATGERIHRVRKRMADLPETDDELYDRKYDEASGNVDWSDYGAGWRNTRSSQLESWQTPINSGERPPGYGIADKIADHGYDLAHPVSLSTGHGLDSGFSNTSGRGNFGKYQVLGGHHRITVMERDRPQDLMSLQWHGNIDEAKSSKSY